MKGDEVEGCLEARRKGRKRAGSRDEGMQGDERWRDD